MIRQNVGERILVERVDGHGLDRLLTTIGTAMVKEERVKFLTYAGQVLDGGNQRTVTYSKSGNHGRGRLYADGALSMQGFSKGIKSALAGSLYHDIDMQNCHPVLLLQVCKRHGWKAPLLSKYIEQREQVLSETGLSRDEAKHAILTIMYGGTPSHAFPFGVQFKREMFSIADLVFRQYPEIPIAATTKANPKFSRLSLLLQDMEHDLLMEITGFFSRNGYETGVFVFDGLMIYRKSDGPLSPALLRQCEQSLSSKMTLTEKPL